MTFYRHFAAILSPSCRRFAAIWPFGSPHFRIDRLTAKSRYSAQMERTFCRHFGPNRMAETWQKVQMIIDRIPVKNKMKCFSIGHERKKDTGKVNQLSIISQSLSKDIGESISPHKLFIVHMWRRKWVSKSAKHKPPSNKSRTKNLKKIKDSSNSWISGSWIWQC